MRMYFTEQVKTKQMKIFCTERDIEYKVIGYLIQLNFSEQFLVMLNSLKINKEEFLERLQDTLRFRLTSAITVQLLVDNVNKILNEMTNEYKSLEIE